MAYDQNLLARAERRETVYHNSLSPGHCTVTLCTRLDEIGSPTQHFKLTGHGACDPRGGNWCEYMYPTLRNVMKSVLIAVCGLLLCPVAEAGGPVTISQVVHCSDDNGIVLFELSDGTNVFVYDTTNPFNTTMDALMLAAWSSNTTIESYTTTGSGGSACGLWGYSLTSVALQ